MVMNSVSVAMEPLNKPPYDSELSPALAQILLPKRITRDIIPEIRKSITATAELVLSERPITHEELTILVPGGHITVSIFRLTSSSYSTTKKKPGIYWIHGGGMISGNRFQGIPLVADWIEKCDAVCVSIEYRLAPEHPDPALIEDCYAGLQWMADNFGSLNIDPARLMVAGQSAGGGLAAGVALLARDRGGPALCAQLLLCPMLDDRNETVSCKQYVNEGIWSQNMNLLG
jgi:acetyl esterase/lipase